MLKRFNLLLVNQNAAQIKLQEAWRASREPDFPIALLKRGETEENGNEHHRSVITTKRVVTNKDGNTGLG